MRKPTARKVKKGKGVPCGKGYISPEYECKVKGGGLRKSAPGQRPAKAGKFRQAIVRQKPSLSSPPPAKKAVAKSRMASNLAPAGIAAAAVVGGVGLATASVAHDLKKSQVDFNSIRQPPNGQPDEKTFAKYDTFQPGDLIRKNFKGGRLGVRQHYAVYVGKDEKTGEHMLIDTGEDWKTEDGVPFVRMRGLTWQDGGGGKNDTEYEKVPEEEMYKKGEKPNFSREEIVNRAYDMLYQRFEYRGFNSNCESFARSIVEGKSYSSQAEKISPLTNFIADHVTHNALKLKSSEHGIVKNLEKKAEKLKKAGKTSSKEYDQLIDEIKGRKNKIEKFGVKEDKFKVGIPGTKFVFGLGQNEYGKDKYKMTSSQIVDYLAKQKVMAQRSNWEDIKNPYSGEMEGFTPLKDRRERQRNAQRTNSAPGDFGDFYSTAAEAYKLCYSDSDPDELEAPDKFEKKIQRIVAKYPGSLEKQIRFQFYSAYLENLFFVMNLGLTRQAKRSDSVRRFDKKQKGIPCGKGYISPEYECRVERARKSTLIDQTSFFGANTIVRPAGSPISYYKEDHPKETWQTTEVQRKKVAELEDKIRDRPKERVHIVDKKGKVVFTNDGDETSVAIDNDVIDNKMEGTVLTHNHPVPRGYPRDHPSQKGVSFSYADIYIGCRGRAAEVRAVSPGYDHSMKPPEGGWDTDFYFDKVAPSWNKHSKRLVPKYNWKIYNKEMDSEEAVVHFVDEMWTEISKDTGMKYERKEVKR